MPKPPYAPAGVRSAARRSAEQSEFYRDVIRGLSQDPRQLPCKYFYDRRGSELFDRICELDEYYPTRTELAIMRQYGEQMAAALNAPDVLVEYGSGSSIKTRSLLEHLPRPLTYVPVDVSHDHLHATASGLARDFPECRIAPLTADFTRPFRLPSASSAQRVSIYFPGSTIGNFPPADAQRLLAAIATQCGPGGGLLIGIDLKKDRRILEAAYNDRLQVTAAFNRNLLRRINRELDGDFDLDEFAHQAVYNAEAGRVEMYLVSRRRQSVSIGKFRFEFSAGDRICTEYSHKYEISAFAAMAAKTGLFLEQSWTDAQGYFAVLHFIRRS